MNPIIDGPVSSNFKALPIVGNMDAEGAHSLRGLSEGMREALGAPSGRCAAWGMPFEINRMHQAGYFHEHSPTSDHPDHH